jgi:DNA-binding response OmpR family regulator
MSGFDLCRKIRVENEFRALPIIFLTSKADEVSRVTGLEIGGDDYVVKPFSVAELLSRVKVVMRRVRPAEEDLEDLAAGPLRLNPGERSAEISGRPLDLTPREFDLLCLFLRKKRRVLTRNYLMERLWGREHIATSRTIDTHIKKIRRELGPLRECLVTVEKSGYRWLDLNEKGRLPHKPPQ